MAQLDLSEVKTLFHENYIHRHCYLTITFDSSLEGETWILTSDGDTYSDTVGSSLTARLKLKKLNTDYIVACGNLSQTITLGNSYTDQSVTLS